VLLPGLHDIFRTSQAAQCFGQYLAVGFGYSGALGQPPCIALLPGVHNDLDAALLFLVEDLVRMRRLCQRQIMSDDLCGNRGILRLHSEAGSNFIWSLSMPLPATAAR